uniref:CCR4-NOT transcription complex subunit 10 n=1 Tax=Timema cristinae TaxID=61476 RepID=A0A7R9H676_TIMCR|nr:unnamed protein product [Timema cristinae]
MAAVFLKGNLEYQRGNYRKAIKVLNSIPPINLSFKETGESPAVLFYNNIGCIHHYMGKPNLACFYIFKALGENDAAMKSLPKPEPGEPYSGRPVHTVGSNKQYELMYNVGVCLLYGGQPTRAFDCLTEAIQVYHMNPRLWLRLAECCIMAHKQDLRLEFTEGFEVPSLILVMQWFDQKGNEHDFDIQSRKKDLVQGVVGSGIHRKLILNPSLSNDNCYSCEGQSYAIPVATLEFASLCLRNALLLLPDVQPEETLPVVPPSDGGEVPVVSAAPRGLYAAPSSPMEPHEVASLRCSVLADSAYVALCLGDSVVALGHAQNLLMQPKLSGDSIEHLNADLIKDLSLVLPPSDTRDLERDKGEGEEHKPLKGWFPHSLPTARAVLQYNLAVAFAIRGELEKAGDTLKQVWLSKNVSCDIPVHVIMLALYIELQLVCRDHASLALVHLIVVESRYLSDCHPIALASVLLICDVIDFGGMRRVRAVDASSRDTTSLARKLPAIGGCARQIPPDIIVSLRPCKKLQPEYGVVMPTRLGLSSNNTRRNIGFIRIVYLCDIALARGVDSCIGNHVTKCRSVRIVAD